MIKDVIGWDIDRHDDEDNQRSLEVFWNSVSVYEQGNLSLQKDNGYYPLHRNTSPLLNKKNLPYFLVRSIVVSQEMTGYDASLDMTGSLGSSLEPLEIQTGKYFGG